MRRKIYNRDGKRAARIILFFPNFSKFLFFTTIELVLLDNLPVNHLAGLQPNKNDNKIFIRLQKLNF